MLLESRTHARRCEERLHSGDDPFLAGNEIEARFQFQIGENDPAFRDDQDNFIACGHFRFDKSRSTYREGPGDGENHNRAQLDVPQENRDYHCALFR